MNRANALQAFAVTAGRPNVIRPNACVRLVGAGAFVLLDPGQKDGSDKVVQADVPLRWNGRLVDSAHVILSGLLNLGRRILAAGCDGA